MALHSPNITASHNWTSHNDRCGVERGGVCKSSLKEGILGISETEKSQRAFGNRLCKGRLPLFKTGSVKHSLKRIKRRPQTGKFKKNGRGRDIKNSVL